MKYNRKAVVAAIVKVQKEKFEQEREKLKAEEPIIKDKLTKATADFISKLTKKQLIKGLEATTCCPSYVYLEKSKGKPNCASFSFTITRDDETDKAFSDLVSIYEAHHNVTSRIRDIDFYIDCNYKNVRYGNLLDKVNREAPYDYELQADELLKSPKLAADIEALRKSIFED